MVGTGFFVHKGITLVVRMIGFISSRLSVYCQHTTGADMMHSIPIIPNFLGPS
jgi:hypothetical protein